MSDLSTPSPYRDAKSLCARFHIHRATLYRLVQRGVLPAPVKLGACSRWRESDVEAALARLVAPADRAQS